MQPEVTLCDPKVTSQGFGRHKYLCFLCIWRGLSPDPLSHHMTGSDLPQPGRDIIKPELTSQCLGRSALWVRFSFYRALPRRGGLSRDHK